jgi:ferredoxin-type protein NapG
VQARIGRRSFLGAIIAAAMGGLGLLFRGHRRASSQFRLRPPGALEEQDFLSACTRCFKCGNACPNDCIQFSGLEGGLEEAFTPYIVARERACILCGECGEVCPTGALKPFLATREGWAESVDMGLARVNEALRQIPDERENASNGEPRREPSHSVFPQRPSYLCPRVRALR